MTKLDDAPTYDPDTQADLTFDNPRAVDIELDQRLTSKPAVEVLAASLRGAAFEFDPDDLVTITTAETLDITDAETYTRGYELLHELGTLEDAHHQALRALRQAAELPHLHRPLE